MRLGAPSNSPEHVVGYRMSCQFAPRGPRHWVSGKSRVLRRPVPTRPLPAAKRARTIPWSWSWSSTPWPRWPRLLMQLAWYVGVCVCVYVYACVVLLEDLYTSYVHVHADKPKSKTAKKFQFPNEFRPTVTTINKRETVVYNRYYYHRSLSEILTRARYNRYYDDFSTRNTQSFLGKLNII